MDLSTKQSAQELGISQTRVRELLASGKLKGKRVGRSWVVDAASVYARSAESPAPGRPARGNVPKAALGTLAKGAAAHELYLQCKELLSTGYMQEFFNDSHSAEEQRFYASVANFFLQEKQRQLIEQGVF